MKRRIVSTLLDLQVLAMKSYETSLHLQLDANFSQRKSVIKTPQSATLPSTSLKKQESGKKLKIKLSKNSPFGLNNSQTTPFETLEPSDKLNMLSIALSKIANNQMSQITIKDFHNLLADMKTPLHKANGGFVIQAGRPKIHFVRSTTGESRSEQTENRVSLNSQKFNFDQEDFGEKEVDLSFAQNGLAKAENLKKNGGAYGGGELQKIESRTTRVGLTRSDSAENDDLSLNEELMRDFVIERTNLKRKKSGRCRFCTLI